MKHTFFIMATLVTMLLTGTAMAQSTDSSAVKDTVTKKEKKKHQFSISNKGMSFSTYVDSVSKANESKPKKDKKFTSGMMLDLGLNFIQDKTDYSNPTVQNYLNVPASQKNAALFNIRQSKSINVNYYPWLESFRALKTDGQKIFITSGIGFQFYNIRYENDITHTKNPSGVIQDTLKFTKNKLGIDYLNVPLMFTFKTRISKNAAKPSKDRWLVYGVGLTEGANIATWSKQISGEYGKVKQHNHFGIADFNTCITGEIGIDDVIRFYGSYQVTSLNANSTGLDQHPISFGIRISGI